MSYVLENKLKMITKESVKTGVVAGFLGSLCCTTPLLIVALGLGSIGFALGVAKYRPFFIVLGAVFLTFSLYRVIKKKEGVCNISAVKNNITMIVVAVVMAGIIWTLLLYVIVPFLAGFVYG